MANCGPTAGLAIPCRTFMPGIKKIYIAPFFSGTSNTQENLIYTADTTNVITGATLGTGAFYVYDLTKEAGNFTDKINANIANHTTSYETTLNVYLSQYSTSVRNKMIVLAKAKVLVVGLDRNGQYWLMGTDGTGTNPSTSNGVDMIDSTATQGKSYATDTNGYHLVFTATEKVPMLEISSSVVAALAGN